MLKRIYVVVAETVDTPLTETTVVQIPGRMAAQAVHAASRMRMYRLLIEGSKLFKRNKGDYADVEAAMTDLAGEAITTIILSARDSRELEHVRRLLAKAKIKYATFEDTNDAVYGPGAVVTALATVPVLPNKVNGILDYLPLWTPR